MSARAPIGAAPKFTRGEWTCFYKPKYDEWHVSLPMTGGSMKLALCPDGIQSENREADAHLIAAAPDLYIALVRLLSLCEAGADPFEEPNRAVVNQALAALSKAHPHLPSGAAACAADSPAGSTSSPIQSGTNSQSDSDAISEVKGKARPENATGVESPLSEPIIVMKHEGIQA